MAAAETNIGTEPLSSPNPWPVQLAIGFVLMTAIVMGAFGVSTAKGRADGTITAETLFGDDPVRSTIGDNIVAMN